MSNERADDAAIRASLDGYNRAWRDYWRYDHEYQDYQVSEEARKAALVNRNTALERFHSFGTWFGLRGLTLIYDEENKTHIVAEVERS